jgi:chitinase
MKNASPIKSNNKSYLKLIKNSKKTIHKSAKKIYINTLTPEFSYLDKLGKLIKPKKCIML